ncbi:MAG: hypothetical protein FD180_4220 [Planctomycetota bacterium]|nr:MAG: hypothetical protein FD180_4220 [Planctomycetota bacterium]
MSMSDSQRIPYLVRDGVLRISGPMKYQDRELRLATMMLLSGPQSSVCIDVSGVPSLCSPEIQFLAKMAESAKGRGKQLRVRLSKSTRDLFKQLELDGLVQIEEVDTQIMKRLTPGEIAPQAAPKIQPEIISLFRKKRYPSNPPRPGGSLPPRS